MCITKNCELLPVTRGLCNRCFSSASSKVSTGKITWEQLEKIGMCEPSKNRKTNLFSIALEEKLKENENENKTT